MRSFDEICKEVGYNHRKSNPPEPIITYFAYKSGEAKEFATKILALGFSKNVEEVVVNKTEIRAYWDRQRDLEAKASELWYAELQNEYSELPVAAFNIIYQKAYDDGHASGYDEVASHFESLYYFYADLKKTMK